MMQHIFGLVAYFADGSSGIHWFRNQQLVDRILNSEAAEICEVYGFGNPDPAIALMFPADLNLEDCGFSFMDKHYE